MNRTTLEKKAPVFAALALIGLFLLLALGWAQVTQAQGAINTPGAAPTRLPLPSNHPERGLVYDGLQMWSGGPCDWMFKLADVNLCTHGPDPAPTGVDISKSVAPVLAAAAPSIVCDGNGVTGNRIQVLYARAGNVADRYSTYLTSFRSWAAGADAIFNDSAAETGGSRHLRFVTNSNCVITVSNVVLSNTGNNDFNSMVSELKSKGYNRTDRKYMVFADANVYCGIGSLWGDDQPGQANANNSGPSYARVDAGCWGDQTMAHETMHNLGGVQMSAPHSSGGWHCVDEWDRMCYSDSPNYPQMQYICTSQSHDRLFDCNHDDYYSTNPPANSYLTTHWNTANSAFFTSSAAPPPTPTPTACTVKPAVPTLAYPAANAVITNHTPTLDWNDVNCANSYTVVVRKGSTSGTLIASATTTTSNYTTPTLATGVYYFRARACNKAGCSAMTTWRKFTVQ